ncbi:MAG: alginate export family protein [Bryobacteraceae bacterium]|jgi:hypothetical protein
MKCVRFCVLALAVCGVTARAQQSGAEPVHIGSVTVSGSVLERYEFWDFFQGAGQSNYSYSGSLLQLAFSQKAQGYDWALDFAAPILLGLPAHAVQAAPLGQYGLGASYFAADNKNSNAAGFFVKQGFFRIKGENSSMQMGRFEFADGMEGKPKDATLTAVRASRIQQHLIGTFGFSDVRRSFDGGHYDWSSNGWNFTAVGAIPTRGVFQTDGWGWVKTPFAYVALTRDASYGRSNAEWRVFGIYYNDDRPVVKTDNRPAAAKARDFGGINIATFGGHYIQDVLTGAGTFDLLGWGAVQTGTWGTETQKSGAGTFEAGFQPNGLARLKPWVRGGFFWSSGDGNPNDNTHGTFFIMLPTPRIYARFPFYNEMNNSDLFGELILRPFKRVTFRSDVHDVWLSNSHDLWYGGGGAFQPWTFGFLGRPSNGLTGLADIYDTGGDFQLNRALALGLYFGYAQGGPVIRKIFPSGADSKFGYIEMNYNF